MPYLVVDNYNERCEKFTDLVEVKNSLEYDANEMVLASSRVDWASKIEIYTIVGEPMTIEAKTRTHIDIMGE